MLTRRHYLIAPAALAAFGRTALAQPRAFDLQAHRGARGLLPENSIPGFAYVLGLGVTTLELDIAITKDRELLVSHDPTLNPDITRDAAGNFLSARGPAIVSMTAAEVAKYDVGRIKPGTNYARQFAEQKPVDGTRIPKLKEVFDLVKAAKNDEVRFAIETKLTPTAPHETVEPVEFAQLVIKAVRDAGLERRTSILSFDWRTLQVVRKEAPAIETVYLTIQSPNFNNIAGGWTAGFQLAEHGTIPKMIKAAGGHTWSCFWRNMDAAQAREAQALGLKVLVWTVNDPAEMRRFMDMGVDGVITDRPDLLRAEMQARGMPLPRATPL